MIERIVIGVVCYLLIGVALFVGCARWGRRISDSDVPEMFRDLVLGWAIILVALPFILAIEWAKDHDYTPQRFARWLYASASDPHPEHTTGEVK